VPAGVFALGYFSLGFLLLKAHAMGFSLTDTVLLYALFNGVCVVSAPMVGRLGDAMGRRRVVLLGYGLYGAINLALIWAHQGWQLVALFALYGVFYAVEESQSKAFIADLEPDRRASAMGAYKFVTGLLYLPASLVAGALWTLDPRLAFGQAALLAVAAIALFVRMRPAAPLVVKSSH
jgi:MFS family permease